MPISEKCCECKRYQLKELVECVSLVFTKWDQCTLCAHCVHLILASSRENLSSKDCELQRICAVWSALLLFAFWKAPYLSLLQTKVLFF